jgi:hypothetical protein
MSATPQLGDLVRYVVAYEQPNGIGRRGERSYAITQQERAAVVVALEPEQRVSLLVFLQGKNDPCAQEAHEGTVFRYSVLLCEPEEPLAGRCYLPRQALSAELVGELPSAPGDEAEPVSVDLGLAGSPRRGGPGKTKKDAIPGL